MFRAIAITLTTIGLVGAFSTVGHAQTVKKPIATTEKKITSKPTITKKPAMPSRTVKHAPFSKPKAAGGGTATKTFNSKPITTTTTTKTGNKTKGTTPPKLNPTTTTTTTNKPANVKSGTSFGGGSTKGFVPGKFRKGPGQTAKVVFSKPAGFQSVKLGSRVAPAWRTGPRRIWAGGRWRVFAPLTALGAVAIGGAYYYPDAYLGVARPYCSGISPEGCRLNWQQIAFEDGDSDWQCVQYCRRPGNPPPARTVALVAPPPPPQGAACEMSIFSEPGFAGANATLNDEQPRLDENGWQNQIVSVKVTAGTWDFFSDPEFTGETMRLQPGDYADLGPQWAKRSGSVMCIQP